MYLTRLLTNISQRTAGSITTRTRRTSPFSMPIANALCAHYSSISIKPSFFCFQRITYPQYNANNSSDNRNQQLQLQQHTNNKSDEQRRFRSNRSRRGLYDGKDIRTGNNLSFSMNHTKRTFKPNVFLKKVYSEILDEMVRFHLTTSTLRSVEKCGGLDNYLLTSKHVVSGEGLKTKKRIINTLKYKEKKSRQTKNTAATNETME